MDTERNELSDSTRMRLIRILNGLSMEEVATASGIKATSIGAIERGRYSLKNNISKLAPILRTNPKYLLKGSPSVDYDGPLLFVSKQSPRENYAKVAAMDITTYFPEFISENNFTTIIRAKISGGGAYVLGRNTDRPLSVLILAEEYHAQAMNTVLANITGVEIRSITLPGVSFRNFSGTSIDQLSEKVTDLRLSIKTWKQQLEELQQPEQNTRIDISKSDLENQICIAMLEIVRLIPPRPPLPLPDPLRLTNIIVEHILDRQDMDYDTSEATTDYIHKLQRALNHVDEND